MAGAWKVFVALGVVALLLIGVVAYQGWQAEKRASENRFNGFDFALSGDGFWVTEVQYGVQPYFIPFYHHPRDTLDIRVQQNVTTPLFDADRVIISVDPDAGSKPVIGAVEISRLTGSKYDILNLPTSSALSRPQEGVDIPVVSCGAPALIPNGTVVIQFVEDPEANAIVRDGNCVILFYKDADESIRVADRYAFMVLQIMK